MLKLLSFLVFLLLNFYSTSAQSCKIIEAYILPGFYTVSQQVTGGFCQEYIVGPVSSPKRLLIQLPTNNVNCGLGDKLIIYSSDRRILFDFCKPIANQLTNALQTEDKYVFLSVSTTTSSLLNVYFTFYLIETGTTTTGATLSTATTTAAPTTTTAAPISASDCGNPFIKPSELLRIVGGIEAIPNSWPWQAFITDGSYICGASLINNNWLVTAAHCLDGTNMNTFKAYLGVHNVNKMESTTVVRAITKAIKHTSYIGQRNSWDNDIALLKLAQPVTFNNQISPVCLPDQGNNLAVIGSSHTVTGWGRTSGFGSTSDVLRQTPVTVQTLSKCGASSDNMICAGRTAPVRDSCGGDSGGPHVTKVNEKYYLSGIVSWGSADCTGDGVYTKVSNYVNWIKNTIAVN